ncbi:hypothetical protein MJO28_010384 [Puccinia striiformis f. sp. tritici]|uniref:Uncharacterized protein n=1 Tax=Puccinia striiformis f. sp. tritici TaxID=168172 RepID=A0ACC0E6E9_9BASI|nr:hypothetical protein MJO28_010384 [Puccinia striiformis f. sp. tritici]
MQRESYRDPSIQTANDYEIRISYLEEIVRFLLARKEPGPLPSVSSASLGGSFRYSIDRGLVLLLSKTTAQSLIITRSSHRNLKKPFNITQTASSTKPDCPLLSTSEPHHKPSRSSSRASPTAYRKRHSIATSDSQISIGGDKTQSLISTRPFPLVSKRDRTDISALVMPSELHALHTINPAQQSNNAIITKSLDPSPTPCLLNAACATTTTSTQTTSSHCCSSSNSLTTPLLSTLPVSTPLPEPALLECSEVFIPAQTSTCTPQHINLPPSPVHATRPLSALTTCSLAIDLTAQVCPDKCDATDVEIITINEYSDISTDFLGSITIVEHNSTSLAPNLAPDLSQLALDHYDEIDNYLKLANADETETKKKKKKKIKKRPIPLQLLTYQFPTLLQLLTIQFYFMFDTFNFCPPQLPSYLPHLPILIINYIFLKLVSAFLPKSATTPELFYTSPTHFPVFSVFPSLGSDLSSYATDASDLSSYATDASNATLVLEFARAHQLSSAHTSLSIYVSILGEYPSPARDTRSASRSRSDFLNIDHQRFADPSTTVRSTKQVDLDPIPEIDHPIEQLSRIQSTLMPSTAI